jgi:hypothetical protein
MNNHRVANMKNTLTPPSPLSGEEKGEGWFTATRRFSDETQKKAYRRRN